MILNAISNTKQVDEIKPIQKCTSLNKIGMYSVKKKSAANVIQLMKKDMIVENNIY